MPALEAATLAACDYYDGLRDGIIGDPLNCKFDPTKLLCHGAESNCCFTPQQLATLRKIYTGVRTSDGELVYPGYLVGGETGEGGWGAWITGSIPGNSRPHLFANQGGVLLFQDLHWDYRDFNLDRDARIADAPMGRALDATDPNLKAFKEKGGKIIIFQGWSDAALSPRATTEYYTSVISDMGGSDTEEFARLYMAPGMHHCDGGPGPNSFGRPITVALDRWVEQGEAPDQIIATKYKINGDASSGLVRTRPLCPYPEVAHYLGSGSIDASVNFVCSSARSVPKGD